MMACYVYYSMCSMMWCIQTIHFKSAVNLLSLHRIIFYMLRKACGYCFLTNRFDVVLNQRDSGSVIICMVVHNPCVLLY